MSSTGQTPTARRSLPRQIHPGSASSASAVAAGQRREWWAHPRPCLRRPSPRQRIGSSGAGPSPCHHCTQVQPGSASPANYNARHLAAPPATSPVVRRPIPTNSLAAAKPGQITAAARAPSLSPCSPSTAAKLGSCNSRTTRLVCACGQPRRLAIDPDHERQCRQRRLSPKTTPLRTRNSMVVLHRQIKPRHSLK